MLQNLTNIIAILSLSERKRFFNLVLLTIITAVIDVLSIASVFPFISLLANPGIIQTNKFLLKLFEFSSIININNVNEFIFFLGVVTFLIIVFSLSLRALQSYYQISFSFNCEFGIAKRLMSSYLHHPYIWFLNQRGIQLGKNILSEVNFVTTGVLNPLIQLISRLLLLVILIFFLLLLDTRSALIIGVIFFLIYFLLFFFIKNILSDIGNERIDANTKRFKVVSEAFEANKEVKIKMLEDFYVSLFEKNAKIYCHNQSLADIISQLPRYFLEILTFGGIVFLLLVLMTLKNVNIVEILPIMTMYALAGYRIIPTLQQIYSAISKLKFFSPALVSLHEQITKTRYEFQKFHKVDKTDKINKVSEISFKKSLVLDNISFAYPNTKTKSVSHVSLKIEAFQNIGIVGVTGCGKTTLLDIIIGLLDPNEGHIKIDGQKINKENKSFWMKKIGYVPQQIFLRDSTIASNIAFGVETESLNFEKIKEVAKISKIHDYIVNELPNGYNSEVGERGVQLSGGQKQRIALARALYNEPEILILDEATSSLDNITEKLVMESMNNCKKNITTIQVAHRLNTVKNCDKIFLLDKGKLVAEGKFAELKEYNETFNKMSNF